MRIRPRNIVVTSNFKIEQIWTGSVFTAIWRKFHKIYKIEDKIIVYKREKHQCSDQFIPYFRDLLNVNNAVPQEEILELQEEMVPGPSTKKTSAEKELLTGANGLGG